MKRFLGTLLLIIGLGSLSAQTVENIRVEQDGDKLNIFYRIGGSTSEEMYFVTLTCSIDGGPVFEPKTTDGDVGNNIAGGKPVNMIVWDVFKDVDEIGEVEFFVKVDMIKGAEEKPAFVKPSETPKQKLDQSATNTMKSSTLKERYFFLAYSGTIGRPVGAKIGYTKNWGFYGTLRYGLTNNYDMITFSWDEFYYKLEMGVGISKKVAQKNNLRTYVYSGIGYATILYEYYINSNYSIPFSTYTDYYTTFDVGTMGVIGRFYFDLGLTLNSYYTADLIFGIGLVF